MHKVSSVWWVVGLLTVMAGLMLGPARQDSATVDETSHLSAGYLHWHGEETRLRADDHPPLDQLVEAAPLLFMNIKYPDAARAILQGQLGAPWTLSWKSEMRSVQPLLEPGCSGQYVRLPPLGDAMVQWRCPTRYPFNSWYYWGGPESQMFGKIFVYGGVNDGDSMLFAGRVGQIALTLLTGLIVFLWTRWSTSQDWAALVALGVWAFQPIALAHGHLSTTDMGGCFGITLALYGFARFLEKPILKSAALAGAATGMALALKFTALVLGPIYVLMLLVARKNLRIPVPLLAKMAGAFAVAGWVVILLVYFPQWAPAPSPTLAEMTMFDIPGWFQALRPVLIPAGFFKGIAMTLGHTKVGGESYLCGQWSAKGWWYYFPAALMLKSPVAFVILLAGSLFMFLKRVGAAGLLEKSSWLGAGVYLATTMTSGLNIGVRHLLPILPLLSVGIGCAVARLSNRHLKLAVFALAGWQAVTVVVGYPLYIQFFSEAVGGARYGYNYLIDSNFDWGQDAKRLKKFLDERQVGHIYLDYFGTQFSIEYLKIPNTRVNAEVAKQIQQGTLVVSVSQLMRPEWAWLRESRQPVARVAHTLFVYQFP